MCVHCTDIAQAGNYIAHTNVTVTQSHVWYQPKSHRLCSRCWMCQKVFYKYNFYICDMVLNNHLYNTLMCNIYFEAFRCILVKDNISWEKKEGAQLGESWWWHALIWISCSISATHRYVLAALSLQHIWICTRCAITAAHIALFKSVQWFVCIVIVCTRIVRAVEAINVHNGAKLISMCKVERS